MMNDEKQLMTEEMQQEISPVDEFYQSICDVLNNAYDQSPFGDFLLNGVKGGKKTVYNKMIRENRIYDVDFLSVLETSYPSISKIIADPKRSIRYEQEVIQVEKAKKIDSSTVRHLASHTHLIKQINGESVIPSKVLATFAEEELAIYENRFIKTLLIRLDRFLEKRFEIIRDNLDSYQSDRIKVTNNFNLQGNKISATLDIAVRKDIEESVAKAKDAFARVTHLRDLYKGLKNSEFMKALAEAKTVNPPIMKTNIILKNPDFKIAYNLWIFLDRYDGLGYDVSIKERNKTFSEELSQDIDQLLSIALGVVFHHETMGDLNPDNLSYKEYIRKKERVKKNLEDELSIKPRSFKLEKNELNEFFFEETRRYYAKSLREELAQGKTYKQSMKNVYRQMLETVNHLFPLLFDIADKEDDTLENQLEASKRKLTITKQIRELKEADVKKTIKDEERYSKQIIRIENRIAFETEKKRQQQIKEKQMLERQKVLEEKRKLKEESRLQLQAQKQLEKEQEKERLRKEKERLKEKLAAKKAKQREREKAKAALKREKMKTSKRRNIRPRKRKDSD